jgi:hypothetical protein
LILVQDQQVCRMSQILPAGIRRKPKQIRPKYRKTGRQTGRPSMPKYAGSCRSKRSKVARKVARLSRRLTGCRLPATLPGPDKERDR